MTIHLLSSDHRTQGLEAVSRLGGVTAHLGPDLLHAVPDLDGVLVLGTCNRVALLMDAPASLPADALRSATASFLAERSGAEAPVGLSIWSGHAAHLELFATAAGLESMVVGEREIAGQLRRALTHATAEGTVTGSIIRVVEHASAVSRRVSAQTSLAGTGRSVVSVALDLVAPRLPAPQTVRALIVGTGAYAGATVTALRDRGVGDVGVYSRSDRAREFAAGHGVRAVGEGGLPGSLATADLVIACRGLGAPVLTRDLLAPALRARRPADRPLVVLDLALSRDVEDGVASLPGVELIDLAEVQRAVPEAEASQVIAARAIVARAVASFERQQAGRRMDPVVCALRNGVEAVVEEETARLHAVDGRVDAEEAVRAMRRLAARLLHHPTVAARRAGEAGREREYLEALDLVVGPEVAAGLSSGLVPPPSCPAHGGAGAREPEASLTVADWTAAPAPVDLDPFAEPPALMGGRA